MTIDIDPIIFETPIFSIGWYGLAIAAAIALAMTLLSREATRRGLDAAKVGNVALAAVVGGIVGARLFHVVDHLGHYLADPVQILLINQGGLAVWGGLVSGGAAAALIAWVQGMPLRKWADAAAIPALAGQSVGRLGCIVNGDAYGGATDVPWAFVYTHPDAMIPPSLLGVPTHPYPVYEIAWNLGLIAVLIALRRLRLPSGALFLVYAAGYGLGRFFLMFFREEASYAFGLQQAQLIGLGIFTLAALILAYLFVRRGRIES